MTDRTKAPSHPRAVARRLREALAGVRPSRLVVWLLGAVVVALGFREFLFSTDDAYIAFRYVRNQLLGHGLVWNPWPFHRVDGYTSFGWVALLTVLARATGTLPPAACHPLTLAMSLGTWTLFVATASALIDRTLAPTTTEDPGVPTLDEAARARSARLGTALLALAGLGLVTNRTFLTWTSSGLETAMFTCLVTGWAFAMLRRRGRIAAALVAALAALTRPEGLMLWALSLGWLAWRSLEAMVRRSRARRSAAPEAAPVAPPEAAPVAARRAVLPWLAAWLALVAPVALHALWHHATYRAWLPNTYYAKVAGLAWRFGLRYVGSFLIEYGAWPAALWLLAAGLRAAIRRELSLEGLLLAAFGAGVLAYYGLVAGGDHFEFKAFHAILPLGWLGMAWAGARACRGARRPYAWLAALGLLVAASWPIAWGHHLATRALRTRQETFKLRYAMAPHFPSFLRGYVGAYDAMQSTLIDRFYCMRHREHAAFFEWKLGEIPDLPPAPFDPKNPDVALVGEVGLLAYRFPSVAVIDVFGLNDRFVARYRRSTRRLDRVGHQVSPPPGYLEAFDANVVIEAGKVRRRPHRRPLSPAKVAEIERRAALRVSQEP